MKMIAALYVGFATALLWGGENIAIVKSVKGDVLVKHGGIFKRVESGDFLQSGDLLQTTDNGTVGLTFNDGTIVSFGPKSVFVVNRYRFKPSAGEYDFDVTLARGNALVETGKIGKLAPQKVLFKVPQGYIGIRGTRFIVDVEE